MLAVLVAAFLISAPLAALAMGAWVHGMARQAQLAQEASRREATAVVLTVTPPAANVIIWQAQARWTAPDGHTVAHQIPVPSGTAVGGTLQVWTDRAGDPTTAPLLDSQVAGQTAFGEALGVITPAVVIIAAGALARRALNKSRMAAWDADWQATGPRWTTRA